MNRLMCILVICSLSGATHAAKEIKSGAGDGMLKFSSEATKKADSNTYHCQTPGCTTVPKPKTIGGGGRFQTGQHADKTAVEKVTGGADKDATIGEFQNKMGQTPGGP